MGKTFDLGNTLADVLKNVSDPDRGPEQIVLLPIASIDADANNFYSMDGVEELAANIELIGLLDPLRVRENPDMPGRYLIVSGHRRRAALWTLYEAEPEKWAKAPCLIEPAAASPELQELRLIYANADTRKMSSADLSAQAQRVEMLLYKLKDQGMEFPGRMRDHVAEACKVSATKLAVLKVIREKLDRPLYEDYYLKNRMNETVAYELAKHPAEEQRRICDAYLKGHSKLEYMGANFVEDYAKSVEAISALKCPANKGGLCINKEKMLDKIFDDSYSYKPCKYGRTCCANCTEYLNCRGRCPLMDEKAKAERAKKREANAEEKAENKRKADAHITTIDRAWGRFGDALRRAGMTDKQLRAQMKQNNFMSPADTYLREAKVEALLDGSCTEIKENDCTPFSYNIKSWDFENIVKIADALDCSLDYLFLRDSEPRPAPAPQGLISVDERYPDEGEYVIAYTRDLVAIPSVYFRAAFMDCEERSVANKRLTGIEYWSPRPQLPAGKKWPGQETIEGMVKQ